VNKPDQSAREKRQQREKKKKKHTALVICHDNNEFWTTQCQFWQWVRDHVVRKVGDNPLTGVFLQNHSEKLVVFSNTILNLNTPNHLREALATRRMVRR
jgi:hypothetical protein